jgi:methylenetetrahydrofolate dehydrogenase (NADP+) / methenyltetrahydrofolate cyclohydrolase
VSDTDHTCDAQALAQPFLARIRDQVQGLPGELRLVGVLATDKHAAGTYSDYARRGCEDVGITYQVRRVQPEEVSGELFRLNEDPGVHGVLVFYPIFGGARDRSLQNEIDPHKDVEGLHSQWTHRLYHDIRYVDPGRRKKAILPCTPVGIIKALDVLDVFDKERGPRHQADGLTATIFNRSEVVGRPLAAMLAHDGARVHSFDIDGVRLYTKTEVEPSQITRADALASSDIVITGVPSKRFELIRAAELKPGVTCINFSHRKNMADDVAAHAKHFLPRVGPITVAMLLRNTLRLYRNFHSA